MQRNKRQGQCFLNAPTLLQKEARLADVHGQRVLEIGAGDGRLTDALLEAGAARVIAVEKDKRFAELLRQRFAGDPRAEIAEGDFLETGFPKVDRVAGNVPYYISAPILFKLAENRWEKAVLMVQKEFAEKMVAKPNESNYGRLSVTAQLAFDIEYVQTVSRRSFSPQPRVDSAIVVLRPTGHRLSDADQEIIRFLFQHRNQSVRKALKHSKKFSGEQLNLLGELAERRVRTLTKEECVGIAKKLKGPEEAIESAEVVT